MTEEPIQLKATPINMKNQKVTKVRKDDLVLTETFMDIHIDFDGEQMINVEDPMMGWEKKTTFFNTVVKRSAITGIEFGLNDFGEEEREHNNFYIQISAYGMPYDTKVYFSIDDHAGARKFFETIKEWILKTAVHELR